MKYNSEFRRMTDGRIYNNTEKSLVRRRMHTNWLTEKYNRPDIEGEAGETRGFCYGLRDHVGVLCDGTVVPCCLDHEGDIPLGNLFEQPLQEIMDTPRARAIYNGFSNRKITEDLCRTCGYMRRFRG